MSAVVWKTKKDAIVEQLRVLIESGEIGRGSKVRAGHLAARFGTSITPVREALRQLEAEGLLVSEPHHGVQVRSADLERVKAVYIVRRLVEPYASCRASRRMSRRDFEQARSIIDKTASADSTGNRAQVSAANRAFHFLFYRRCGIPALTRQIEDLWLGFPWDILQVLDDRIEESMIEHRAILSAVEEGDLARIRTAVGNHLGHSYRALALHMTGHEAPDPFDLEVD